MSDDPPKTEHRRRTSRRRNPNPENKMKVISVVLVICAATLLLVPFFSTLATAQTVVPGGTITIPPATVLRAGRTFVYVNEGTDFQPPAGHQIEFLALASFAQDPDAPSTSTPNQIRIFLEQKTDAASTDWVVQAARNNTYQPASTNIPDQNEDRLSSSSQTPIWGSAKYPAVVRVLDRSTSPGNVTVRLIGQLTRCAL